MLQKEDEKKRVQEQNEAEEKKKADRQVILIILVVVVSILCIGIFYTLVTKKKDSRTLTTKPQRGDIVLSGERTTGGAPRAAVSNPHYAQQQPTMKNAVGDWKS